uniref:Uncharacterized protein n=1 Tax=Aegilops tauschii subsp. strangulata TaxID=200361 RepID=A0A453LN57_AEGTS
TPRSGVEEEDPTSTVTDVSPASTGSESPSSNSKDTRAADGDQHGVAAADVCVLSTPTRSIFRTPSAIIRSYAPVATSARAPFPLSGDPGVRSQLTEAPQISSPSAPRCEETRTPTPVPLTGNASQAQVGASSSGRWGQVPRCTICRLSVAGRVMTCCEALLCVGCAASTSCGCPRRLAGFGGPVPLLPRYVIPDDHIVEFPVLLPRARWELFHTRRSTGGGSIFYSYFSMEDAFHRRQAGVLYQIHEYVVVGRRWTQFICRFVEVQGLGLLLRFAIPPMTPMDIEFLLEVLDRYRQLHDE